MDRFRMMLRGWRLRTKECCCCGERTPPLRQWHNRDLGYGLCRKCAEFIKARGRITDAEFLSYYGHEGFHYPAA